MFFDELKKNLLSDEELFFSTKLTLLNNNILIIEGYKKLLKYENDEISYQTQNGSYRIIGKNLKIFTINPIELLIKGEIIEIKLSKWKS